MLLGCWGVRTASSRTLETVVLSTDAVPGRPGETFGSFHLPSLNATGDVLLTNNDGVYTNASGSLETFVRLGDTVLDSVPAGATVSNLGSNAWINSQGQVATHSFFSGVPIAANSGYLSYTAESIQLELQRGQALPMLGENIAIDRVESLRANLDGLNRVVTPVRLLGNVDSASDSAILRAGPSGIQVVAREGDPSPIAGQIFANLTISNIATDDSGDIAFRGFIDGPAETNDVIFSDRSGVLLAEYRQGDVVTINSQPHTLGGFGNPRMNRQGELAFISEAGVYVERNGQLTLAATFGQPVPGPTPGFITGSNDFLGLRHNSQGDLTFGAKLSAVSNCGDNTCPSKDAILTNEDGTLRTVAVIDGSVPGLSPDYRFVDLDAPFIDAQGQTIFTARYSGPEVSFRRGLFVEEGNQLQMLLQEGDDIEIAPGDIRTISNLLMEQGAGSNLIHRTGVSDAGDIAFRAQFTDGTQAILVSRVEEDLLADWDNDADVDGADFLLWQGDQSAGLLADWSGNYGRSTASSQLSMQLVPEPSTVLLLAMAMLLAASANTRGRAGDTRSRG